MCECPSLSLHTDACLPLPGLIILWWDLSFSLASLFSLRNFLRFPEAQEADNKAFHFP